MDKIVKQGYIPKWGNFVLISFDQGRTFFAFKRTRTGLFYEGDPERAFPGLIAHLEMRDRTIKQMRESFEVSSPALVEACVS